MDGEPFEPEATNAVPDGTTKVPVAAKEVYVLIRQPKSISRSDKAMWLVENMSKPVKSQSEPSGAFQVLSVISGTVPSFVEQAGYQVVDTLAPDTEVVFLYTKYVLVFTLDMTPSTAVVVSCMEYSLFRWTGVACRSNSLFWGGA